jgi:hypothetical protein
MRLVSPRRFHGGLLVGLDRTFASAVLAVEGHEGFFDQNRFCVRVFRCDKVNGRARARAPTLHPAAGAPLE